MSKESLPLEVAFEIRTAFPDSKLLVGVPLDEGDGELEMDILGLVGGKKLAIKLSNGVGSAEDCASALADVERLCGVAPDLTGLALAIVRAPAMPENIGGPWPAWRNCEATGTNGWADVKYCYTWVPAGPDRG
jgi:hypothetical protein